MERILNSERPFVLAAACAPIAVPNPAHARVGQPAVPGSGHQGISGSVVSQNLLVTHNYMTDAKQATWLRATKARGVPPRGWPV